jgi:ubiquinone/menaquinone biosynthesis C-methylase UbiE
MPKDLFSKQASTYAAFRPGYPAALFDYILSFVPHRQSAWDCATGNGQAASELAPYFQKVYATDISAKQIEQAIRHPNIIYSIGTAEASGLQDNSVDLITIAQAYHWFNFKEFENEVKRVARPHAVIAMWCYTLPEVQDRALSDKIYNLYSNVLGTYWDKERTWVEEEYRTIPFPFAELPAARFEAELTWTRQTLEGYLNSWSSVQRYKEKHNFNPVDDFIKQSTQSLKENEEFTVRFPIFLRIGKVHRIYT